jgi:hypothetical protein
MDLTDAIIEAYVEIDIPADQLVSNSVAFLDFQSRVFILCRPSELVSGDELKRLLLNLRKNGKLPRLRRKSSVPQPGIGRPRKVLPE